MNLELLKNAAEILSALILIGGIVFACYRWYLQQNKQNEDIHQLKEENALICFALQACLDGLEQLGANHTVPEARHKLEKHLNQSAHR